MSGQHLDVIAGKASKENVCERCGTKIVPGQTVVFYPLTKTVAHAACHLAKKGGQA